MPGPGPRGCGEGPRAALYLSRAAATGGPSPACRPPPLAALTRIRVPSLPSVARGAGYSGERRPESTAGAIRVAAGTNAAASASRPPIPATNRPSGAAVGVFRALPARAGAQPRPAPASDRRLASPDEAYAGGRPAAGIRPAPSIDSAKGSDLKAGGVPPNQACEAVSRCPGPTRLARAPRSGPWIARTPCGVGQAETAGSALQTACRPARLARKETPACRSRGGQRFGRAGESKRRPESADCLQAWLTCKSAGCKVRFNRLKRPSRQRTSNHLRARNSCAQTLEA